MGGEAFRAFKSKNEIEFRALSQMESIYINFLEEKSPHAVGNFHFHSPELIWSFFALSLKTRSSVYDDDHDFRFYQEKLLFYNKGGFDIKDRPARKRKLHGFEQVKNKLDGILMASEQTTYQIKYRDKIKIQYPQALKTRILFDKNNEIIADLLQLGRV